MAYALGWLALLAFGILAHGLAAALVTRDRAFAVYVSLPLLLLEFVTAWLSICLVSRRLHDLDRSGWWQVIPLAVLLASSALAEPAWAMALGIDETTAQRIWALGVGLYVLAMVLIGVPAGKAEAKRYGQRSS